jgi:hypothetical protein
VNATIGSSISARSFCRSAAKLLTRDEARRIAAKVAKLETET